MKKLIYSLVFSLSLALPAAAAEKIENFSHYYRQDCAFISGATPDVNDWCNRGNAQGKSPNVVMQGDSYSNSWSTVLAEYAQTKGSGMIYEQYGRGQCPVLLGISPPLACGDLAQKAYDKVKNTPSIQTVMLASNWISYFGETRKWNDDTGRVYKRAEIEQALENTIKAYQALGRKVVVVYQAPQVDEPKACAERRIRIGAAEDKCSLTKAYALRNENYRAYLDPIIARTKASTFDPFLYMCDAMTCKTKDGSKIFFASRDHFSGFGGEYLAHKAASDLKKLLQF